MRILITGGAGFLGTHVVAALRKSYPDSGLAVVDAHSKFELASQLHVSVYPVDLREEGSAEEVFAEFQPTHVVHLAATVLRGESNGTPASYLAQEMALHKTVGELCTKYQVQKLIHTSSAAVYGEPDQVPTPETALCRPIGLYGESKLAGEEYFHALAADSGVEVLILRLASLYGPGARSGVLHDLIERSQSRSPLKISGDGSQTRDFLYVADVAAIIAQGLATPMTGTYNVGSGTSTTLRDLAGLVQEVTETPSALELLSEVPPGVRRNQLDTTKLRLAIPYQYTDLATGLRLTLGGGAR